MDRKLAEKAARWWADQLRGEAKLDNGDMSDQGAMTFLIAKTLQQSEKQNQVLEQIDTFEHILANTLELVKDEDLRWFSISVDYYPDQTLQAAANAAGLRLGMTTLPWKTYMDFRNDGTIKVTCDYRAKPEVI